MCGNCRRLVRRSRRSPGKERSFPLLGATALPHKHSASTANLRGGKRPAPVTVDLQKAARFIAEIRDLSLSKTIDRAVDGYEKVGDRNVFLWKWVRRGVEITTLSCVDAELWDDVCDTKTLGVMFDVLLDDVADAGADPEFLETLIAITRNKRFWLSSLTDEQREYFRFSESIWKKVWRRLKRYPRYEEFRDILAYDYRQLMNAMRYSVLIRKNPSMMNIPEHDSYLPHNMHIVISGTIDLMASTRFEVSEFGHLRKVLLYAQYMGRIGNLITTWEREVRERDYSSGIFPLALSRGVLTVDDLVAGDQEKICRKIRESNLETRFLVRWQELRTKLTQLANRFKSVNIDQLGTGLDTLIQLHMGSRGLK